MGRLGLTGIVGPIRDVVDGSKPKVAEKAPSIDNMVYLLGLDSSLMANSKPASLDGPQLNINIVGLRLLPFMWGMCAWMQGS